MRLSVLSTLLAATTVASLVSAEPIRVAENPTDANIRFGHALMNANVNANDDSTTRIVRPVIVMTPIPQVKNEGITRHFCGSSLREKALRLSNAFRQALGLPLIEADVVVPGPGPVHILPVGYPSHNVILHSQEEDDGEGDKHRKHHGHKHHEDDEEHEHHPHHKHHGHHGKHRKSFLRRIHHAIKSLGPWEGRAVAFVLGCGIGVLLRMFWVMSVLTYRTVRGERAEPDDTLDREYIVYEQVPETLFVAPPEYIDEKVRVESEEVEERK